MTRVHEDGLHEHVARAVRLFAAAGCQVIIMSGRTADAKEDSARWLRSHGVPFDHLLFRAEGDNRPDQVVKHELFCAHVAGIFEVLAVFDDRLRAARLWHSLGLPLFRVGDPDANF